MRNGRNKTNESVLLKQVLAWLKFHGCYAFRVNTTGVFDPVRKIFRKSPNITKGVSDILFCTASGRFGAVECKSKGNKPSRDQHDFLANIRGRGGIAIWSDDFNKAVEELKLQLKGGCNANLAESTRRMDETDPR